MMRQMIFGTLQHIDHQEYIDEQSYGKISFSGFPFRVKIGITQYHLHFNGQTLLNNLRDKQAERNFAEHRRYPVWKEELRLTQPIFIESDILGSYYSLHYSGDYQHKTQINKDAKTMYGSIEELYYEIPVTAKDMLNHIGTMLNYDLLLSKGEFSTLVSRIRNWQVKNDNQEVIYRMSEANNRFRYKKNSDTELNLYIQSHYDGVEFTAASQPLTTHYLSLLTGKAIIPLGDISLARYGKMRGDFNIQTRLLGHFTGSAASKIEHISLDLKQCEYAHRLQETALKGQINAGFKEQKLAVRVEGSYRQKKNQEWYNQTVTDSKELLRIITHMGTKENRFYGHIFYIPGYGIIKRDAIIALAPIANALAPKAVTLIPKWHEMGELRIDYDVSAFLDKKKNKSDVTIRKFSIENDRFGLGLRFTRNLRDKEMRATISISRYPLFVRDTLGYLQRVKPLIELAIATPLPFTVDEKLTQQMTQFIRYISNQPKQTSDQVDITVLFSEQQRRIKIGTVPIEKVMEALGKVMLSQGRH